MNTREFDRSRGVVLVTDISRDHGARVASEFLEAGWNVAVTARTVAELVRIMAGKPANRLFAIVADPADHLQADRILDRVTTRFGAINRVIDPAGLVSAVWMQGEVFEAVA
ncbi:SDR family NAD(P)-dependent oxidoreductase [Rhodococcus sp. IEGM 1379]|uniref:SDR family NAD(P)-dependent oxidoreductase n=1 Tax=Rhodococcus sp. IEGM 1379 TaxID=3047086 RepID=UPI0024B76C5D|nr:SDR family NAD(P)-dependent oxidoreductase [Rhodococcus sp. IEGM 1379]MDI9914149.1 SDR family NAD(P)-dependent oxidoreductase [Rhodococcus sp. IEGM 1379]